MPPPCTAGHALWHSASVVHEPQLPLLPPLLEPELLPLELVLLPLSSSLPLLLPEEELVLPPEEPELVLLPLSRPPEELVLPPSMRVDRSGVPSVLPPQPATSTPPTRRQATRERTWARFMGWQ